MHSHSVESWQHAHFFLGAKHDRHERRTWFVVALTAAMMVAAWKHAPGALRQARNKGIAWAKFEGGEMSDLLAYLASLTR